MEKRVLPHSEVRASMSGHKMKVSGYAATYETLSRDLPAGNGKVFKERIAKRAFDKVLATNPDVVCTFNHNNDAVLGRTTSGTLQLRGDDTGLAFECDLPNTQIGRDVYESVKRGDLNGCSFAFELGERGDEEWNEEEEIEDEKELGIRGRIKNAIKKILIRTIKSFRKLHDVSIVTCPAYPGTQVDARNLVSEEVRSYVQRATKPAPKTPARGAIGVYFESDADDLACRNRRKQLLDLVLE